MASRGKKLSGRRLMLRGDSDADRYRAIIRLEIDMLTANTEV